ncbi:MAG: hypothetical protein GY820_28840, partial [Gammaproteobacteria bacterium]|nr:hypothetical protein [Gammaproteobacteria bacterium]
VFYWLAVLDQPREGSSTTKNDRRQCKVVVTVGLVARAAQTNLYTWCLRVDVVSVSWGRTTGCLHVGKDLIYLSVERDYLSVESGQTKMVWTRSKTARMGKGVDLQLKTIMDLLQKTQARERAVERGNQRLGKQQTKNISRDEPVVYQKIEKEMTHYREDAEKEKKRDREICELQNAMQQMQQIFQQTQGHNLSKLTDGQRGQEISQVVNPGTREPNTNENVISESVPQNEASRSTDRFRIIGDRMEALNLQLSEERKKTQWERETARTQETALEHSIQTLWDRLQRAEGVSRESGAKNLVNEREIESATPQISREAAELPVNVAVISRTPCGDLPKNSREKEVRHSLGTEQIPLSEKDSSSNGERVPRRRRH